MFQGHTHTVLYCVCVALVSYVLAHVDMLICMRINVVVFVNEALRVHEKMSHTCLYFVFVC